MAQSVARQAVNLQVAGSNPAGGDFAKVVLTQSITTISAVVVRIPGLHPGDPGSNPGGGQALPLAGSVVEPAPQIGAQPGIEPRTSRLLTSSVGAAKRRMQHPGFPRDHSPQY